MEEPEYRRSTLPAKSCLCGPRDGRLDLENDNNDDDDASTDDGNDDDDQCATAAAASLIIIIIIVKLFLGDNLATKIPRLSLSLR